MKEPWATPHYGSHIPALVDALAMTDGPVLELGAGDWSTPMLHWLCHHRTLVTVETNPKWMARYLGMRNDWHAFEESDTWWATLNWSVVLIDGPRDSRAPALTRFNADIYVVHDTEPNHRMVYPGLEEEMAKFKHRRDYSEPYPNTTLVSNTVSFKHAMLF